MTEAIVILALIFLIVTALVTTPIIRAAGRRRMTEDQVSGLVDSIIGRRPDDDLVNFNATPDAIDVSDNLLAFFSQSFSSRTILSVLTTEDAGMTETRVSQVLNIILQSKNDKPLPEHIARKIIMNLMGANLIRKRQELLTPTEAGRKVIALLQNHGK